MLSRRRTAVVGLRVLLVLAACEGLFFVTGSFLQSKWGMWRAPTQPAAVQDPLPYEQYLKRRDPLLGWPYPAQFGQDLEVNGAQRNPFFPNGPGEGSCISLYGDSFTAGGDTSSSDKNWGNVLSSLLSCYVANYGVGGYGTDQACLRFEGNTRDPSPIVILGFHTDDVLRNLTRIRDLQNYERWYALKPRFVLDTGGELRLVPIPDLTEDQYLRSVGISGELYPLANENFQPGGPAGAVALEFPYSISVTANLLRFHGFRARRLHRPEWMEFLEVGHRLHGLEIAVGISQRFVDLALRRGKAPLLVILPHPLDFKYFQGHAIWPYQNVVDGYSSASIPYIDFGPYLLALAAEQGTPVETFFGPTGHYNDAGNAAVAKFVRQRLPR